MIVTHAHGDHCHGIDELRPVRRPSAAPVPLYAREQRARRARAALRLCLRPVDFYRPIVERHQIDGEFELGESAFVSWISRTAGRRRSACASTKTSKSAAYAIDFSDLTDDMAALYEGVDVWIADCLTRTPHPTHAHLDGVLGWARTYASGNSIWCTWATASIIGRWWRAARLGGAGP